MSDPIAFCSWSGGKDSALAVHRARQQGFDVRYLLAMLDESGQRSRSHAIPVPLLKQQANALGCELITRSAYWHSYEEKFIDATREMMQHGAAYAVFGDIDLQPHRDWEEKVCAQAGVEAVLPLWRENRRDLVEEVLQNGFEATVVCVNAQWLDARFCGRPFNRQFLADLPEGVDWCGENGEFHTFVTDGPDFAAPVGVQVREIYEHVLPPEFGSARFFYASLEGK